MAAPDPRSLSVQQQLQLKWRRVVRKLPSSERLIWLRSAEGIVALGARNARQLVKALEVEHRMLRREVPSSTWFDDVWYRAVRWPPGGKSTRMRRSRVSGRWTPSIAIDLEDMIDRLGMYEAARLGSEWPASPSALVIRQIESVRAREARM